MVKLTVYPKTEQEEISLKKYLKSKGFSFEESDIRTKSQILLDLEEGFEWSKKVANGEISETKTLEELLNEIENADSTVSTL
jgi:hypothetical protein